MEVNHFKNNELVQEIEVKLVKEDYLPKVEAELKKIRKTAQVPGFRAGNAPMPMIKKMYQVSVLADVVNEVSSNAFFNFLQENKLDYLFEPKIDQEKSDVDYENNENFTFYYEFASYPKFDIDFAGLEAAPYFTITASNDDIDARVKGLCEQFGDVTYPEEINEETSFVLLAAGDKKMRLFVEQLNEEGKKAFAGKKKDETLNVDFTSLFTNEEDLMKFVEVEAIEEGQTFAYDVTVEMIFARKNAEVNAELFEKVYPGKEIATEEAFRAQISADFSRQYEADTTSLFYHITFDAIMQTISIELPKDFIMKHVFRIGEVNDAALAEQMEKEYESYKKYATAKLVEARLAEMGKVNVTQQDVKDYLFNFYYESYFASMPKDDETVVKSIGGVIEKSLENKEQAQKLHETLLEKRLAEYMKTQVVLKEMNGSAADFEAFAKEEVAKMKARGGVELVDETEETEN